MRCLASYPDTNMAEHLILPVTISAEETDEYASIYNDIKTYVDEMFIKFVNGDEPIENFDKYVAQLKTFGLDKVIKMKQSALERYNSR